MRIAKCILVLIFGSTLVLVHAQTKYFEFSNPNSILLDNEKLEILTAGYWRIYKEESEIRGTTSSTAMNISVCYYPDGTFFFNGSTGTWKVLESKYIDHQFEKAVQDKLNFGGIFSVSELNDSTLTITKLLTSSHDMKRIEYLRSSTVLTKNRQSKSGYPYLYEGVLTEATIDSLSRMDSAALSNAGYTLLQGNTIHIMATDTMHIIRLNNAQNRHQSFPISGMNKTK